MNPKRTYGVLFDPSVTAAVIGEVSYFVRGLLGLSTMSLEIHWDVLWQYKIFLWSCTKITADSPGEAGSIVRIVLILFTTLALSHASADDKLSDNEIREILIEESIRNYSGNCPCPYNAMRNGRRCGKNNAYSKPGGASPLCYPSDVTDRMIEQFKKNKE